MLAKSPIYIYNSLKFGPALGDFGKFSAKFASIKIENLFHAILSLNSRHFFFSPLQPVVYMVSLVD